MVYDYINRINSGVDLGYTMAFLSNSIFFILIWIFEIPLSTAHYCVWGLCDSGEYCCGENVCCSPSDYNIWILLLIAIMIVFGVVAASTCIYYNIQRLCAYLERKYRGVTLVTMPSEFESDVTSIKISYQK